MLEMTELHWRPATFYGYARTLVGIALGYAHVLLFLFLFLSFSFLFLPFSFLFLFLPFLFLPEPGTVKMQEYSKVNKEKELSSVFFCDIVFQQSTQTV